MRDPVTPDVANAVMARDAKRVILWLAERPNVTPAQIHHWFEIHPVCVAPIIDPHQLVRCWGRSTLEHVRKRAAMGGRRAPSDLQHLVTLCWHHHMDGWATSHKPEEREYLEKLYGPME